MEKKEVKETNKVIREETFIALKRDPDEKEQAALRRYVRGDLNARQEVAGIIQSEETIKNLTPLVGRNVFARLASGNTTYSGEVNYGCFGSGSAAFSDSSEHLNTEVYRKLKSDAAYDGDITYVDWFILSGDVANQTFTEFMAVIDGTASADTGLPISILLTGGWVKSGSIYVSLKLTWI